MSASTPSGLLEVSRRSSLESGFTSVPDVGQKLYPWLPVKFISKFKYASIEKVGAIPCPKLIIHSPEDDLIPYEHGKALFNKASPPKEFLDIAGGHNDGFLVAGSTYTDGIHRFLSRHLKPPS